MSQYYFIVSHLNGMVLDVNNGGTCAGTKVHTQPKHGGTNQQWRDDPCTGTIRSRLNDFCMDIAGGQVVINPYEPGKSDQQWERRCKVIVNRCDNNMLINICDNNANPGATIIKYPASNTLNESWTFEPASC
jgi:hypothetical protein